MNTWKVVSVVAGGLVAAALVGGGILWWRRCEQKADGLTPSIPDRVQPGPTPSGPPRPATNTDPRCHYTERDHLDPELRAVLDERFPSTWPPDNATIDALTQEDVIIFAVDSEPTGNYTNTRQELIKSGRRRTSSRSCSPRTACAGDVSVRALDEDPKEGTVFVARWDFVLEA